MLGATKNARLFEECSKKVRSISSLEASKEMLESLKSTQSSKNKTFRETKSALVFKECFKLQGTSRNALTRSEGALHLMAPPEVIIESNELSTVFRNAPRASLNFSKLLRVCGTFQYVT